MATKEEVYVLVDEIWNMICNHIQIKDWTQHSPNMPIADWQRIQRQNCDNVAEILRQQGRSASDWLTERATIWTNENLPMFMIYVRNSENNIDYLQVYCNILRQDIQLHQ